MRLEGPLIGDERALALALASVNLVAVTPLEALNLLFSLQQRALASLGMPHPTHPLESEASAWRPARMSQRACDCLPPEVIERIAAGEVIERPASVVRELIANALDAGATDVRVEMREGGLRLLRVS